jgi:rhodanese-related sulfurtransferase
MLKNTDMNPAQGSARTNAVSQYGRSPAQMIDDVLRGLTFEFLGQGAHKTASEDLLGDPNATLLDVRTDEEVRAVRFPLEGLALRSLHIPLSDLPDRTEEVPSRELVAILCVSDVRSAIAYVYLQSQGFRNVRILTGGTAQLLNQLKTGNVRKQLLARRNYQMSKTGLGRSKS